MAVLYPLALLREAQHLLLVLEVSNLSLRRLDAAHVALLIRDFETQQLELLRTTFGEVLLPRAVAQARHGGRACLSIFSQQATGRHLWVQLGSTVLH